MKQTKGAIGNLLNRYRAVLKKCHLLNTFGSLAVASMLVMGGVGVAQANDKYPLDGVAHTITITSDSTLTFTPEGVEGEESHDSASQDIIGGYWVNDTLKDAVDGISTSITIQQGENVTATYNGEVIGGSLIQGATNAEGSVTVNNTRVVIEKGAKIGGNDGNGKYNNVMAGGKVNGYGTSIVTGTATLIVNGTVDGTAIGGGTAKKPVTQDNAVSATVDTTEVTINGEATHGVVGGGVSDAYNAGTPAGTVTSSVDTTNVTINEGAKVGSLLQPSSLTEISAAVVGGGIASGSNALASAGTTNVTINGGDISNKVVAGGAAINGGEVKVDYTNLTMTGGDVTSDLVGGNLLSGGTEEAGITSTNVRVTNGTVHGEIYGGTYVRNTEATASVDSASVTIDGGIIGSTEPQSWAQYVVGGGKAMSNGNYTAQSDVTTTTVTITGGEIVRGAVIGGGFTRAQGATGGTASATVENATVSVSGGSLSGVVAGGLAESTASTTDATSSSTVTTANLSISGNDTVVNGIRYMANDEATEGKYEETPASQFAVVGGGLAYSMNGKTATSAVTTSTTNISGGTINGSVVTGGMAHGAGASTSVVDTANLNISGGTINGSVYAGGANVEGGTADVTKFAVTITGGTITGNVYVGDYTSPDTNNISLMSYYEAQNGSYVSFGGTADVQGDVIVTERGSTTIVDGTDVVKGDYKVQGATDTTLAFNNYTTSFNNVATGFDTVEAYAGSTVTVDHLSTGTETAGQEGFFDVSNVAGEGEIIASNVGVTSELGVTGNLTVAGENSSISVTDDGKVTIGDGGKVDVTKANSITTEDQADIAVNAGGTFDIAANQITEESKGATLASGATVNIIGNGDADPIDASTLASKFGTDSTIAGIVNVEGVEVTNLFNTAPTGDRIEASNVAVMGIATDQTKSSVLTEVDNQDNKAAGAWKAVVLAASVTDRTLVADRDLQLVGSPENSDYLLVSTEDGQKGNLRIGASGGSPRDTTVTLGHEGQNNKGTLGDVIMSYTGGSAEEADLTLKVVGDGNAVFQVDNINGGDKSNKTIYVEGAILKTKNISGTISGTPYDAIQTVKITKGGSIEATGVANVVDVTLAENSSFTAAKDGETGGDITIKGDLSGVGTVDAANKLEFTETTGFATEDGDVLTLSGDEVAFTSLNSTDGTIHIDAGMLTTTGTASVKNDTVSADKWNLGDTFTAGGKSVLQAGQFGTTDNTSTLTKSVTLNDTSLLVHGDTKSETLAQAQEAVTDVKHTGATYYSNKNLTFGEGGALHVNAETGATDTVVFGSGSMLVVDSNVFGGTDAPAVYTGSAGSETASVAGDSWFYAVNAQHGDSITVFENFGTSATWDKNYIHTDTPMLEGTTNTEGDIVFNVQDPVEQFPGLSGDLAPAVYGLYVKSLNDVKSPDMGVRFLSRATNDAYLGRTDRRAAAATIESAARMAFAGAVPQMTKMASDSATNSVVNRMGFANPENGAKAMNVDGKLVDDKALGLALWIAPLWSNQTGFGMEAGNLDYGYNANIGGISLGADYTWANNFRAGLMFNIGGGYAESSGDLSETTNSMTFWGVGAYGGWKYENFAVMGDVSYTSTWNSVDQDVDHRMQMGDLESDIQASAISAGLRFEYKLETQYLDLIPHVGARYMSINTWGYDVETNGGTVLEGDGFQQNIWTFPVGITFSKELEMNNDWYFKPSVDFTVIPAAGDIKAKEDVLFTGMQRSYEVETQMMDYFTWQGGVGLEFGNDNMSVGVNYTLQAGQNSTGHGVFGMFRYEF